MPPILDALDSTGIDPDEVPRAVVAYGVSMDIGEFEIDFHEHRKSQLIMPLRGLLTCEADGVLWIVPPQSAIWIPGGVSHSIRFSGAIEGYNAFIDPTAAVNLSSSCCAVSVTPLLRELLIRAGRLPALYPEGGSESHLVTLLLDEIAIAPLGKLSVPMPTDPRLRRIVKSMMANPARRGTMDTWAKRAGLSERTLARRITQQTGMSFGRWRQQLSVMLALQWMADGTSVQQVAANLGYESAGSFVSMFRKTLGDSPARFMARARDARPRNEE